MAGSNKKQAWQALGAVSLIGGLFLMGAGVYHYQDSAAFAGEALEAQGTISKAYDQRERKIGGKGRMRGYYFDISYFPSDEKNAESASKAGETKPSFLDKLKKGSLVGNIEPATVSVTPEVYEKYKAGDRVELLYSKENAEDVRLKEMVTGFSMAPYLAIGLVLAALAGVFFFVGRKK